MAKMPLGIKILAGLQIAGGILFLIVLALFFGLFSTFIGSFFILGIPAYFLIGGLALACILLGWGLWNLQSWAWWITFALYAVTFLASLVLFIYSLQTGQPLGTISNIPSLVIGGAVTWYLYDKKRLFT